MSGDDNDVAEPRPVERAHEALGLWSIRRALTLAFSGAATLLVVAWFFVSWLLGSPPRAEPEPLDTATQLELLKLVFALVAGAAALVALVTAYRRQRVDEAAGQLAQRAQANAEHDATEQRVTALYGQAVEQLGHDKAAVRLGGLYSLERLAQDHPQHRQTVTDVVCAYLRMPFQPPADTPPPDASDTESAPLSSGYEEARQEVQVRLAAQRLLQRHLTVIADQPQPATYWHNLLIDLTGAHLIDFDFASCRPGHAIFTSTRFSGIAGFGRAKFSGAAWFNRSEFSGDAWFAQAEFGGGVVFEGAEFGGDAFFNGSEFSGAAAFGRAEFSGNARFDMAQFSQEPDFDGATASNSNADHAWPSPWQAQAQSPDAETAQLCRASP